MKCVRMGGGALGLSFLLVWSGMVTEAKCAEGLTSAEPVIKQAIARAQRFDSQSAQAAFAYTKVTLTEELDAAGRVREHKEKVYEVSFQNGTTEVKLVSVNGHPPGEADRKRQAEDEKTARQMAGKPKRGKGDNRERLLTPELAARFDFALLDRQSVNGRPAYRIAFAPKNPTPPARHLADRLLDRLSGTLWIDAEEFEVARAEIHLASELNLLGGVLGSLKKFAFTLTRTRIADGVWLSTASHGDFEGRKLLDSLHIKTKSKSTNFRPVSLNVTGRGRTG